MTSDWHGWPKNENRLDLAALLKLSPLHQSLGFTMGFRFDHKSWLSWFSWLWWFSLCWWWRWPQWLKFSNKVYGPRSPLCHDEIMMIMMMMMIRMKTRTMIMNMIMMMRMWHSTTFTDEGDGSRSPVCQSKGISCLAGGQLQYFAIETNTKTLSVTNTSTIESAIKASEMLEAPWISECFGLPWSALVCFSLPWSAIVCLGLL